MTANFTEVKKKARGDDEGTSWAVMCLKQTMERERWAASWNHPGSVID